MYWIKNVCFILFYKLCPIHLINSLIRALIRCIKFITMANKCILIYECNLITQQSSTCYDHSFGHLQCVDTQNTNIIIM